MNHVPLRDKAAPPTAIAPADQDAATLGLRAVHRAAAELKRGTPVLITGDTSLLAVTAETIGAAGLRDLAALAAGPALLLLAPSRAASILQRPVGSDGPAVAIRLTALLSDPEVLRGLADPTAGQLLPEEPQRAEAPAQSGAALALAKLARLLPAVVVVPVQPDGEHQAMALGLLSVAGSDILAHPLAMAEGLRRVAEAAVPLEGAADSRVVAFRAPDSGVEHLAILVGRPESAEAPLVRVHSECFTGDLLGSLRCDCGPQLKGAIGRMGAEGAGVLLYLAQEGRGIGLVNKLRAYAMQDRGLDTLDANRALGWGADERNFLIAATMLDALGIKRVRLLTNNPEKVASLAACGIEVVNRESHVFEPNGVNDGYLATKAARFGHMFE
ncbi:MAG: GTP cyclohydrolase II [Alphaproteobacteria bacterium]|nr:GTP cyclohydrolase II [Alphaproteobacteria bacterium]